MSVGLTILKVGLSLILNAAMLGAIYWAYSQTKPQHYSTTAGVIGPNKPTVFIFVMIGFFVTSTGILLYANNGAGLLPFAVTMAGSVFFVGSLFGFSSGYNLNWNDKGIEGLSKQFTLKMNQYRTFISWDDIRSVEENALQNYYIESNDGRRIFWNYAYDGDAEFQKVLISKLGKRYQLA